MPVSCGLKLRVVILLAVGVLCNISAEGGDAKNSEDSAIYENDGFGKPFVHAAVATNLTVTALYNKDYRIVQLNVSWIPPKDTQKQPESYNLHVLALNDTASYCQSAYLATADRYYRHVPKEVSYAVIPQRLEAHIHNEGEEMIIRHECTYNVVLESNPNDGVSEVSANITVPECLNMSCSCRRTAFLPRPKIVSAKPSPTMDKVFVTFTFPPTNANATNASKFIIDVGSQLMRSVRPSHTAHHVYNMSWVRASVAYSPRSGDGSYDKQVPAGLEHDLSYKVRVAVFDTRGCFGPYDEFLFKVPPKNENEHLTGHPWLMSLLPSLSFVLIFCLSFVLVWQRCSGWLRAKFRPAELRPLPSWQGAYKAVGYDANGRRSFRTSFPSMQERNVIYVEKEIEDAKARGDADMYEVSYDRLELGREIGKGAFGRVFLARADAIAGVPGLMTVAVKKLKQRATEDEVEEFLSEIAMLKKIGRNPHIVTMLGCCTINPPFCMLMEYLPCGDLLQYLRRLRVEYELRTGGQLPFTSTRARPDDFRPNYIELQTLESDSSYIQPDAHRRLASVASSGRPSITETEWSLLSNESEPASPSCHSPRLEYVLDPRELQNFAVQIARGMAYLEQRRITHRDLAARNVLMDGRKTLKISDFGLSRSGIYINTKHKKVPLRWLSIEAMRDNLYSSKSDVWAYAIVLWEIGTLGGYPYPTVNDYDLLSFVAQGNRLAQPDNCTDELYALMTVCWSHSADARPSFASIVAHLEAVGRKRRVYVDFSPHHTFPPTEQVGSAHSAGDSNRGSDKSKHDSTYAANSKCGSDKSKHDSTYATNSKCVADKSKHDSTYATNSKCVADKSKHESTHSANSKCGSAHCRLDPDQSARPKRDSVRSANSKCGPDNAKHDPAKCVDPNCGSVYCRYDPVDAASSRCGSAHCKLDLGRPAGPKRDSTRATDSKCGCVHSSNDSTHSGGSNFGSASSKRDSAKSADSNRGSVCRRCDPVGRSDADGPTPNEARVSFSAR